MKGYSIELRTKKIKIFVKIYRFLLFVRNLSNKYGKKILCYYGKKLTRRSKIVHKIPNAATEFIGNIIVETIVKLKPVLDENSRNSYFTRGKIRNVK